MIPLRLGIRNFMCYGEQVPPLDFSGIQLACVAGDNGHGKSALIDAITWAVWGKARTQRDDDLIYLGKADMQVEFEFALDDNHYRIIRQRRKNGTRGRTTLEFQIGDAGRFRSLTGNTARQTQAKINETLRMDYETFINSAFLLQGRANEFTTTPPSERKRILGEILGLSLYDTLEERAKGRVREGEVQLREITAGLSEIEKELTHKGEYELELQEAEKAAAQVSESLRAEEEKLRELREAMKELILKREQLGDLSAELETQESELRQTSQAILETQKRISEYEAILTEAVEIESGYAALIAARQENEELSRRLTEHAKLNQARAEVQRSIDEAKNRVLLERELCAQKVDTLETKARDIASLTGNLEQLRARLHKLSEMEQEKESMRRDEENLSNQMASLKTTNAQLKADMNVLKEKLDLLEEAKATCPLCGTPLATQEREHIRANYATEGKANGDRYRQNLAGIHELTESMQETRRTRKAVERELAEMGSIQGQEATLQKSLDEALTSKEELEKAKRQLGGLDERLTRGDFAAEERTKLIQLDQQIGQLGYAPQRHEEIRERLSALSHFDQAKAELETARHSLSVESERLQELEQSRARLAEDVAGAVERKEALHQQIKDLEQTTAHVDEQSRLVEELQVRESRARLQLGGARQKLEHCLHLESEKEKKLLRQREAMEQKAVYEELRLAFGKKGIQAMIIEAAIPEIEVEANRLLSRMTEGRMHVRLKSQRQTLKGKAVETLDIEVSDELGPRSYDLFSGGEAFRIDFAIRIALSKLLSRRAGARLQTLIIDEGFGTQDAQGRERLVEAINSVQQDFERILVITHIEELKDAFPVRIDVFKTPDGSHIAIR
jgi:exonuclease SbcC